MPEDITMKLPVNIVLLVIIIGASEYYGATTLTPFGRRYGYDEPPL